MDQTVTLGFIINVLAIAGLVSLLSGIVILIFNVFSKETQSVQKNAAKLVEKGLTDDLSGAMGNAGMLIRELNTLIETKRGIGMALLIAGAVLLFVSIYFLTK